MKHTENCSLLYICVNAAWCIPEVMGEHYGRKCGVWLMTHRLEWIQNVRKTNEKVLICSLWLGEEWELRLDEER